MSSNLKDEDSRYLKTFATSLVNWYPWGETAFQKARDEKKFIFLSIGYSTSKWCTVMQKESFDDAHIAKLLNENFISIKVDKDEQPDIDKYYKNVYKLMNGQACASPISIFLTENMEPFYTATYIAPYPKGNVLGFQELLEVLIEKHTSDKETMTKKGQEVLDYLNPHNQKIEATRLNKNILDTIINHSKELLDNIYGGFGEAPKFPHISTVDLLIESYLLREEKSLLFGIRLTLDKMANGELYDSLNGAFYRYTNNQEWTNPRKEKMLYDNALMASLYIRSYTIIGEEFYKEIAFKTIDYMVENMAENHLFYANSLEREDGSLVMDKKQIVSWNAMMIDTLFQASTIDKKYLPIATSSLEQLLEVFYLDGKLYHTKKSEAFLEDYAYLGLALLSGYMVGDNEEYLILAQSILNQAIEKFYEYGRWRFSNNSEFTLYDDTYDTLYPSAMATILSLMERIEPLVESDYSEYIFKTLEFNSYNLMRQPLSSPKMTKVLLLHLKDDIMAK
jgi:uncharacterized protein YyaL (SSP411 family)